MIRAHNNMKVLITGTTGWLGGELAKKLAEQGHSVVGLARRTTKIENVTSVQADLEDGTSITRAINEHGPFDVVVHLAGCLGWCGPVQVNATIQTNSGPVVGVSSTTSFGNHSESCKPDPSFTHKTRFFRSQRTAQRSDLREQSAFRRRGSLAEQRTTPRSSRP